MAETRYCSWCLGFYKPVSPIRLIDRSSYSFCMCEKQLKTTRSDLVDKLCFQSRDDEFSTPEAPDSWPLRPALTVLRPCSVSGRVAYEMVSETILITKQTTRARHSINHLQLVFIFQTQQPFCLSQTRGTAKIICSHHIAFGRPCLNSSKHISQPRRQPLWILVVKTLWIWLALMSLGSHGAWFLWTFQPSGLAGCCFGRPLYSTRTFGWPISHFQNIGRSKTKPCFTFHPAFPFCFSLPTTRQTFPQLTVIQRRLFFSGVWIVPCVSDRHKKHHNVKHHQKQFQRRR